MKNSIKNKRNSIEEDIKILESIIKINNDYLKGIENQTINQKEIKALQNILSDYKLLQEEFRDVDHECDRLERKEIKLEKENAQLKEDIKEMYYKEAVITIMCDNFNLSRNEALKLLGDEE